jgi:predicted nucleotidyltransferase
MNRDDVLRILVEQRDELREKFGVKSLALFGSVARDETNDTSDVDLLIEFDRPITLFDLVAVQQRLENALGGTRVDIVMRDAIFPAIREDILEDAIHVG